MKKYSTHDPPNNTHTTSLSGVRFVSFKNGETHVPTILGLELLSYCLQKHFIGPVY